MKTIDLKNVKEADLVLKGKEKEAYLEFLEAGGFAEMKNNIFKELEHKQYIIAKEYKELSEYRHIKSALHTILYTGWNTNSEKNPSLGDYVELFWSNRGSGTIDDTSVEYYTIIFKEFLAYLTERKKKDSLEEEFKEHYKLLNANMYNEKELVKMEYKIKLKTYKDKVRKSFWRKILK